MVPAPGPTSHLCHSGNDLFLPLEGAPWLFKILRIWPVKSRPGKLGCQLESHDINKREPPKKDGSDVEKRSSLIPSVVLELSSNLLH